MKKDKEIDGSESTKVFCSFDKMVETVDIKPNPKNPNQHPQKQIKLLAKIIKAQGWRAPITISNRSGLVVRGHGRLMAAKQLKLKECPVDFQDYETNEAELADLIADNKIAELAIIDEDMIIDIFKDLEDCVEKELTGFDEIFEFRKGEDNTKNKVGYIKKAEEFFKIENPEDYKDIETIFINYSGGKDSSLALVWAREMFPQARIIAAFSDTGVEFPDLFPVLKSNTDKFKAELIIVKPELDWWTWILENGWPSGIFLRCKEKFINKPCNQLARKENPKTTLIMDGSRATQSTRGSKKTITSKFTGLLKFRFYHPCFYLTDELANEILNACDVTLWPGYALGFNRTACWCCPGQRQSQAQALHKHYPGLAKIIRMYEKKLDQKIRWINDKSFDEIRLGKKKKF